MIEALFGSYPALASLLLRLTLGTLFTVHGYPKLAPQRKQGEAWMKSIGMPAGFILFGGIVEFFGGLGLILGILTPIIALLSAIYMLGTTWFSITKAKKKYQGGYELDITLFLAALALAFLGSGTFSIDHLIGW